MPICEQCCTHGTIVLSAGIISVNNNPGFDYNTMPQYTLTITATDTTNRTTTATYTVDILPVLIPPSFDNLPNATSVAEDTAVGVGVFEITAIDENSDDLQYILVTAATPFILNATSTQSTILSHISRVFLTVTLQCLV